MKACVKATGEIVEVNQCAIIHDGTREIMRGTELDEVQGAPDYWTRLEHQYAGMAMQGILSNPEYLRSLMHTKHDDYRVHEVVPNVAVRLSHALVEKLKEE